MAARGRDDDEDDAEDEEQAGAAERLLYGQEVGGEDQIGGRYQEQKGPERSESADHGGARKLSLREYGDGGDRVHKDQRDCDDCD